MTETHEKHKELIEYFDAQLRYRKQLVRQLEEENAQILCCLKQIKAENKELVMVQNNLTTNQESIRRDDNKPRKLRLGTQQSNIY